MVEKVPFTKRREGSPSGGWGCRRPEETLASESPPVRLLSPN
jgi:hypothetical protein